MRKLIALAALGVAVALSAGCATTETAQPAAQKQFLKCSTCGAEFTSPAGLQDHIKSHPDHK